MELVVIEKFGEHLNSWSEVILNQTFIMEIVKKKLRQLKTALEEAEARAKNAEDLLNETNAKADAVYRFSFFLIFSLCDCMPKTIGCPKKLHTFK